MAPMLQSVSATGSPPRLNGGIAFARRRGIGGSASSRFCVRRIRCIAKSAPHIPIFTLKQGDGCGIGRFDVQRNNIGKAILLVSMTACVALGAAPADARSGHRHGGGGDLAAAASPYAILAPITVERTPGGAGRAAFEGDWSGGSWSCPPGAPLLNGDGWRCK
jgi:hypothetical protein